MWRRLHQRPHALAAAGRLTEVADLARTALNQTTPPAQVAHLHYVLSYILLLAGRPTEAVTEAEKALSGPDLSAELRGLAEQVLFQGMFAGDDGWRGHERAQAIVAAAERHTPPARASAHTLLAGIDWAHGQAARAIEHIREAVRVASDGPIQAQHTHPRLLLANALIGMRQLEEAETVLQTADQEITALGHTTYAVGPAISRARLRLAAGRIDDAAAEAQAGLAMAEDLGMHVFDLMGIAVLALVAARHNDIDTAIRHAEQHRSRRQAGQGGMYGSGWCQWVMALVAEAHAGPETAIDALSPTCTDPTARRRLLMAEPGAAAWVTRTALAAGDHSTAQEIVISAESLAENNPDFATLAASAAHARGVLHNDAVALAHGAATHVGTWDRASAAEDLGVRHAARPGAGGRDAAIRSLDQALQGYEQTDALRDTDRIRARLRKLGVRRHHGSRSERPASGWDSLTDTEHKIATLVAQGLTNPQVAARVFISPHTVKFHLCRVFRKLGIASRVELARLTTEHAPDV
ncbi:LuxR C-terminal-related transcriptional regulator [Actinoallomurus sp. NPDC050550]|uniref:helix-turn-helix transcriptional regulator n=1 Tax=Actinoallomurus sp. NPDC050550 TaxID=3154937 RepID=UPI0033E7E7E9